MTDLDVKRFDSFVYGFILASALFLWFGDAEASWEVAPYAAGALDYQIDSWSDRYSQTGCRLDEFGYEPGKPGGITLRTCTGSNPLGELQLGFEFAPGGWRAAWYLPVFRIGLRHRSHLRDGFPFNDKPETSTNAVMLELKLGGLR